MVLVKQHLFHANLETHRVTASLDTTTLSLPCTFTSGNAGMLCNNSITRYALQADMPLQVWHMRDRDQLPVLTKRKGMPSNSYVVFGETPTSTL